MKLTFVVAVSTTAFITLVTALPGMPGFGEQEEGKHKLTNIMETTGKASAAINIGKGEDTANIGWKDGPNQKDSHTHIMSARDFNETDYDFVIEKARQEYDAGNVKRGVIETKGMTECSDEHFRGVCRRKPAARLFDDIPQTSLGCINRDYFGNILAGSMIPERGIQCYIYFQRDCMGKMGNFPMVYPGSDQFAGKYWQNMGSTTGPMSYLCEYISFGS